MSGNPKTRRELLGAATGLAAVALASCQAHPDAAPPPDAPGPGPDSDPPDGDGDPPDGDDDPPEDDRRGERLREIFDEFDGRYHEDGGSYGETNDSDGSSESGLLAWAESYVMRAYLLMFRAHGDTAYLDSFVDHTDAVLANRDSVRGVTDYRGESSPAWRADSPFTIGRTELEDAQGRATLELRSGLTNGDAGTVTVTAEGQTFDLVVHNWSQERTTSYHGLTMDPDDADYAVDRINREGFRNETPDEGLVTVADLRDDPEEGSVPVTGEFELESPHYVFAVHTGLITLPLVDFAETVLGPDAPEAVADYEPAAERYLEAAERAVAVHDDQWRETDAGEGYYVFEPGSPTLHESVDLPHNQMLALGRSLVGLAALTDDPEYADRARGLARTFGNDVRTNDADAYVWSYYWSDGEVASGWSADEARSEYRPWAPGLDDPVNERPDDIHYGHIAVEFAARAFDTPAVSEGDDAPFRAVDMERFARTYTENVATPGGDAPGAHEYVNGAGETSGNHELATPMWTVLTPWEEDVLEHSEALLDARLDEYEPGPDVLLALANLNYWRWRT